MGFIRKILIFITGYAWLLLLLGPGLIAMSVYSGWKAEGDHAYTAREKLTTVTGKVSTTSTGRSTVLNSAITSAAHSAEPQPCTCTPLYSCATNSKAPALSNH